MGGEVHFHPPADDEFHATVRYYEDCRPGLGVEFAEEVYLTIARILEFSDAWAVMSKNTRRYLVSRFPYGVIFQIKSRMLRIIAIANLYRHPDYWKNRT